MLGKSAAASAVALLSLFSSQADAYWRMSCPGTLFTGRVDPIVNPGTVSGHSHVVLGGNGFAPNMTAESTQKSTCTTCTIKGDLSNYWTPTLYYQAKNGSFISVPLAGGQGGTVYYQQRAQYKGNTTITAFPLGFRMLAGNPFNRVVDLQNTTQQAISFTCLDYSGATKYPEGEILPTVRCPDGVRAQVYFPQCWNGKDLDSHDHQSHMAYPSNYNGGDCPDTHPVPTMGLFYEFLYDTGHFDFYAPSGAQQPFVFSMGDPTGRGFHGDFISGWDVNILQNGINKKTTQDAGCAGDVLCDGIFEYPDVYGTECSLPPLLDEQTTGVLDKLPGCNPVSLQASDAASGNCDATKTLAVQTQNVYADVTSAGFKYLGCGNDTYGANALPTKIADTKSMTVQTCVKQCSDAGYKYAGLEYSSQCFCGNDLAKSATPLPDTIGDCHMPCSGDASQTCGDANRLSLYQKCDGGDCSNAFVGFIGEVGSLTNNTGSLNGASVGSGSTGGSSSPSSAASSPAAASSASSPSSAAASASAPAGSAAASTSVAAHDDAAPTAAASSSPSSTASPSTSSSSSSSLPSGWTSAGCYSDSLSTRALSGITFAYFNQKITTSNCATYCGSKGYSMAGTEYGTQCFCGNSLNSSTKEADGDCNMKCEGDEGQMCGGSLRLSVVSTKAVKRRGGA